MVLHTVVHKQHLLTEGGGGNDAMYDFAFLRSTCHTKWSGWLPWPVSSPPQGSRPHSLSSRSSGLGQGWRHYCVKGAWLKGVLRILEAAAARALICVDLYPRRARRWLEPAATSLRCSHSLTNVFRYTNFFVWSGTGGNRDPSRSGIGGWYGLGGVEEL